MKASDHRGFTLIEVVVSISILAMLVLATVTAMRSLASTQKKLENKVEYVAQMAAVSRYLRSSIERARPEGVMTFGQASAVHFLGGTQSMQWVSPMPVPGQQGLWVSRLELSGKQLILRLAPGIEPPNWSDDDISYVLVSDVEEFAIAYRASRYAPWVSLWSEDGGQALPAELPSHAKLQLKVAGRYWPELVINLQRKPI